MSAIRRGGGLGPSPAYDPRIDDPFGDIFGPRPAADFAVPALLPGPVAPPPSWLDVQDGLEPPSIEDGGDLALWAYSGIQTGDALTRLDGIALPPVGEDFDDPFGFAVLGRVDPLDGLDFTGALEEGAPLDAAAFIAETADGLDEVALVDGDFWLEDAPLYVGFARPAGVVPPGSPFFTDELDFDLESEPGALGFVGSLFHPLDGPSYDDVDFEALAPITGRDEMLAPDDLGAGPGTTGLPDVWVPNLAAFADGVDLTPETELLN